MMWSLSNARLFEKCQRQWFYKTHVANANATKNLCQREAYILSTLNSVDSWRGKIVDLVISNRIVRDLEYRRSLNGDDIIRYAKDLFNKQREFALLNRVREPGMSKTSAGDSFASLYAIEYGAGVTDEEFARAWSDIEHALENFLGMRELIMTLRRAEKLAAQRPLKFSLLDVPCRAVPDLIAFFKNDPPLIVDWKVHTFGTKDYRRQLAIYALALTMCEPHIDFPASVSAYGPTDLRLMEVQLLTNRPREYTLVDADIEDAETYIAASSTEIKLALGERVETLTPGDFPVTEFLGTCDKCPFRMPCWKEPVCQELKQMTLL